MRTCAAVSHVLHQHFSSPLASQRPLRWFGHRPGKFELQSTFTGFITLRTVGVSGTTEVKFIGDIAGAVAIICAQHARKVDTAEDHRNFWLVIVVSLLDSFLATVASYEINAFNPASARGDGFGAGRTVQSGSPHDQGMVFMSAVLPIKVASLA